MTEADAGDDRYADIRDVIDRVVNEDDFPEGRCERLEITLHASGEATWRAWELRAEEPVGGYFAPADSS